MFCGEQYVFETPCIYMRNVDHKALGFSLSYCIHQSINCLCVVFVKKVCFFLCKSMLLKNVRTNRSRGYKIHGRKSLVVYHKLLANGNSEHRLVGEKKGQKIVIKGLFCYMHKAFLEGRGSTAGNIITFSFL